MNRLDPIVAATREEVARRRKEKPTAGGEREVGAQGAESPL